MNNLHGRLPAYSGTGHVSLHMPVSGDFTEQCVTKQEQLALQAGAPDAEVKRCSTLANQNKLAFLTWRDLTVTVQRSKGKQRQVVQSASGYLEPRCMLAIMGPSGCGKTTLLDALAGRLPTSAKLTGQVLLNGHASSMSHGTAAYVTQEDVLIGSLTVLECLMFVARLRLPSSMSAGDKRGSVETILSEMGLQGCKNTFIGAWPAKAISGGQKRRLSIACELITDPNLIFLDEPTSGLDSASAYHVIRHIKGLSEGFCTIVAVIHQPSSEVFSMFDQLCLLANGQVVFFGPAEQASHAFERVGLPVPLHANPADHFLHCINADFEEKGGTVQHNIESLHATYLKSHEFQSVGTSIAMLETSAMVPYNCSLERPGWAAQTFYLTWRNLLDMSRNAGLFWIRAAMYIMLCLVLGFVYFQLGHTWHAVFSRTALLFFGVAFLTFMSIAAFPAFVEDMKVFMRERLNGYYGVSQFVVANTIAAIPFVFLIAVLSSVTVYWLASLNGSGGSVIYFILDLFLSLLAVESMMMAIAPLVPHYLMGIAAGAGLLGIFMLTCGFFQPAAQLPRPVLYYPLHYLAFHTYSFYGFMKNEFVGTEGWGCPCSIMPDGCSPAVGGAACSWSGDQVLASYGVWSLNKWVDLAVLAAWIVFYRALFLCTLKLKERLAT